MPVAKRTKSRTAKPSVAPNPTQPVDACPSDPLAADSGSAPAPMYVAADRSQPHSHGPFTGAVWLTTAQAAARAGYSVRQLKRWIKAGHLKSYRAPSPKGQAHLRIRAGDLEALIAYGAQS